jgi:hypothetical protein
MAGLVFVNLKDVMVLVFIKKVAWFSSTGEDGAFNKKAFSLSRRGIDMGGLCCGLHNHHTLLFVLHANRSQSINRPRTPHGQYFRAKEEIGIVKVKAVP